MILLFWIVDLLLGSSTSEYCWRNVAVRIERWQLDQRKMQDISDLCRSLQRVVTDLSAASRAAPTSLVESDNLCNLVEEAANS